MRHSRRLDHPYLLEPPIRSADIVVQPLAAAEKDGHDRHGHLVDQAGGEILLHGACAAADQNILTAGGSLRCWRAD
jgi:hypothetical protein